LTALIELLELEFRHHCKYPYLIQPVYSAGLCLCSSAVILSIKPQYGIYPVMI
jgi:hypothetical protein